MADPLRSTVFFVYRAAGSGSQCQLRATQRVLSAARARARAQGKGGGGRRAGPTTLLGHDQVPVATCDPVALLRARSAHRPAEDLAAGALSPRRAGLWLPRPPRR